MAAAQPAETPTGILKQEHRVIERVLRVLDRIVMLAENDQGLPRDAARDCVAFLRLFADACHHGKEEDMLFPALEQRGIPREGGPIGVMLYEHKLGRQHIAAMAAALAQLEAGDTHGEREFCLAARQYIELLTGHIHKEDNILFRMGEAMITGADCAALCSRMGEFGCRAFEGRRREDLERLADQLVQRWLG